MRNQNATIVLDTFLKYPEHILYNLDKKNLLQDVLKLTYSELERCKAHYTPGSLDDRWAKLEIVIIVLEKKLTENLEITLNDVCKGKHEYESITAWFVKSGLIDPVTLKWKDRKSGYKRLLANYLKDLEIKGYTGKLDDAEIMNIAQNTFGVEIGISTIQHIIPESDIPPFNS